MKDTTKSTKVKDITRNWFIVDVKDQTLGRISTDIAHKLLGKSKTNYVRNLDCGDHVVVINAAHIVVTGKKEKEKMYGHYSGHPGGLKQKPLWLLRRDNPTEIIRHSVMGMIPVNKLRDRLMTRLYIFPEAEHTYKAKFIK
jgi:large subunit ribosomal protein L13